MDPTGPELEIAALLESVKPATTSPRSSAQAGTSGTAPFILARLDAQESTRPNNRGSLQLQEEFTRIQQEKLEDDTQVSGPVIDWGTEGCCVLQPPC